MFTFEDVLPPEGAGQRQEGLVITKTEVFGNSDSLYWKGCSFLRMSCPRREAGQRQEGLVITKTEVFGNSSDMGPWALWAHGPICLYMRIYVPIYAYMPIYAYKL